MMSEQDKSQKEKPEPLELLSALWEGLKENYPMMEYAGAFDESWFEEYKQKIQGISDLNEALPIMDKLVKRLNDYHTSLRWEGKPTFSTPPIALGFVEEQVVITASEESLPVKPGDIVLKIDDEDAVTCFNQAMSEAFGATKYAKLKSACQNMIEGPKDSNVKLRLLNPSKGEFEISLEREGWSQKEPTPPLSSNSIDDEVGYIRVCRWGGFKSEEFDAILERFKDKPYLLIDVRDNGGGSDNLAGEVVGRFIDKKVLCSISFHRRAGTNIYEKTVEFAEPRGEWRYEGRVAVLINEGCASACEHFVSGMFEAGATLVGVPTSGACGWMKAVRLPGNVTLSCSLTFPLHGRIPSPLNGIPPHHLVTPTFEDIRSGRDVVLQEAIEILKGDNQC